MLARVEETETLCREEWREEVGTLKRRFMQALVRGHNDKAKRGPKFLLLDYEEAELLAWCDFHQQHYQTPDLDEVAGKVWWLHTGFTETCPCMCIVSC